MMVLSIKKLRQKKNDMLLTEKRKQWVLVDKETYNQWKENYFERDIFDGIVKSFCCSAMTVGISVMSAGIALFILIYILLLCITNIFIGAPLLIAFLFSMRWMHLTSMMIGREELEWHDNKFRIPKDDLNGMI